MLQRVLIQGRRIRQCVLASVRSPILGPIGSGPIHGPNNGTWTHMGGQLKAHIWTLLGDSKTHERMLKYNNMYLDPILSNDCYLTHYKAITLFCAFA